MTRNERTRCALMRRPVDRLPTQINYTAAVGNRLARHLGVTLPELPEQLGNHLVRVDLSHRPGASENGRVVYDWWGAG